MCDLGRKTAFPDQTLNVQDTDRNPIIFTLSLTFCKGLLKKRASRRGGWHRGVLLSSPFSRESAAQSEHWKLRASSYGCSRIGHVPVSVTHFLRSLSQWLSSSGTRTLHFWPIGNAMGNLHQRMPLSSSKPSQNVLQSGALATQFRILPPLFSQLTNPPGALKALPISFSFSHSLSSQVSPSISLNTFLYLGIYLLPRELNQHGGNIFWDRASENVCILFFQWINDSVEYESTGWKSFRLRISMALPHFLPPSRYCQKVRRCSDFSSIVCGLVYSLAPLLPSLLFSPYLSSPLPSSPPSHPTLLFLLLPLLLSLSLSFCVLV